VSVRPQLMHLLVRVYCEKVDSDLTLIFKSWKRTRGSTKMPKGLMKKNRKEEEAFLVMMGH